MKNNTHKFQTIAEFHHYASLPKPEHPLVSLIDYGQVNYQSESVKMRWIQSFYSMGLKRDIHGKFRYGQQQYDFDEGLMSFVAPQQLVEIEMTANNADQRPSGWMLLVHPDFIWNTHLAQNIKKYDFFGYAVNEALFLSEKEETLLVEIFMNIRREYQSTIDKFSQDIIVSQIELLLKYSERFYERQFITRKKPSHQLLTKLEKLLSDYFDNDSMIEKGLPTVQFIAENLNLSPNYLSSMLTVLTGQSTQQHIQNKLIDKAKERLSTTQLSISEIAYELGFEYPASFTKLFKSKTNLTPNDFRQSFN